MNNRYLPWLLAAFGGVVILVVWGDPTISNDKIVASPARSSAAIQLRPILPRRHVVNPGNADLFGAASVEIQTSAPPQSFQQNETQIVEQPLWSVIGKHLEGASEWSVFLSRNEQTLIVRVGDVLDDGYRVVSITPPVMVLQHVKRHTKITLDI